MRSLAANAVTMRTEQQHGELKKRAFASGLPARGRWRASCVLLLVLIFAAGSQAQNSPPKVAQQSEEATETIRVDTELVDLNVSVFARNPRLSVGELGQKDFEILENGVPQEISFFASSATPFDLILLIDLSGSTSDKLSLVRKSAQRFVEAARPVDRIGIVTFANVPRIVSPLTSDRAALIERIKKIEKPRGGTSFWDALRFVLEQMVEKRTDGRRSAVVVMTDGIDNALPDVPGDGSTTSFEQLLDIVRNSDAIVLPIYLDTEPEMIKERRWFGIPETFIAARAQLGLLAAESGSQLYRARKLEDLNGVYEQVIRDLGMIYSIGYSPTNKERDGSWRSISVRLVNRPDIAARTRRGYFAR